MRSCGREAEGGGLLNRYTTLKSYRGFESLRLRQSLPSEQSPRPFGTAEKPRKRGLLLTKVLTAASARNAVLVSLSPVVSKAPDFAILVRNFKPLILNGYSARRICTFRILLVTRGALRSKRCDAAMNCPC